MKPLPIGKVVIVGFALIFTATYQTQAQTVTNVTCNANALAVAISDANDAPLTETILNLAPDCLYPFTAGDPIYGSALPPIRSPITINGNGATIRRDIDAGPTPDFRLLYVDNIGGLTLRNVTVQGGKSPVGGGIVNAGGELTLINSTITDNEASSSGGGIYNDSDSAVLTVVNSTLSNNSGGGIYNNGGMVSITDSTISGNGSGGGVSSNSGTLKVSGSSISGNGSGGVFKSGNGTAAIINSTISNNLGSGIYNDGGTLTVTNSTISGNNSGNGAGGGIRTVLATTTVINSVISGNKADFGGGVMNWHFGGTFTIVINSTIAGNYAISEGGGTYGTAVTIRNSIVWGNNTQIGGSPTVSYSVVQGGFVGGSNISASDPLFVDPKPAGNAPTTLGDYHIRDGSSAYNTGSNNLLPDDTLDLDGDGNTAEKIPFDRDGVTRIKDGTVDRGAYEWPTELELLNNRDFELDANDDKVPDGWSVKNPTSDKLKCSKPDKTISYAGNCAFKFKGGVGEKAKLQQDVGLSGVPFAVGDALTLSAYFNGSAVAVKAKFILKVKYASAADPVKRNIDVGATAGYALITVPELVLEGADVSQIKVMIKHKSTASKLYVDAASLSLARRSVRSDVLPVPAAPEGMRGFN